MVDTDDNATRVKPRSGNLGDAMVRTPGIQALILHLAIFDGHVVQYLFAGADILHTGYPGNPRLHREHKHRRISVVTMLIHLVGLRHKPQHYCKQRGRRWTV
jgi:hypothetical protein